MEKQAHDDTKARWPEIIVGDSDYERLTNLATAALDQLPDTAEELLSELERATVVADDALPGGVVRMGSVVEFRTDVERRRVTLVFPSEANIEVGKVSVLTPIGTALIGLSEGETISWNARDGRSHDLTVLAVEQPAPGGAETPGL